MTVMRFNCEAKGCYLEQRWDPAELDGCLPRGASLINADGWCEIGGHFLMVEHKRRNEALSTGQMRALQRLAALEEFTVVVLRAAAEHVRRRGGGWLGYWASAPTASEEDLAAELGLVKSREIYQLRRPLPVKEGEVPGARDVPAIRHFIPGSDEQAWVAVNNRAFAGHPDQGGWGVQRLLTLESEAWFDPQGFLIHEREGRMAGFCWTKVHPDEEPALGEIYVIAVDPDVSGRGLGRGLTLAGLDYLATKGLSVGMLYVDETNEAARRLYGSLGFSLHHVDRMYSGRF